VEAWWLGERVMGDIVLHDTYYIVGSWAFSLIPLLVIIVLVLGAAALVKYLFFR
jgi:hypothetical protein